MISKLHSNRRPYNWLIYDTSDRLLEKYKPLYKGKLYDLGAGEAPYREFFLRYAEEYVAIDWSNSLHDTDADVSADLNQRLPIDSEVADTVISLSVLEHLYAPQTMINEAFRILKTGGAIVLQVPWQWRLHEMPHDYFRYTPSGLEYLFKQAGFVEVAIEPQAGFFTTIFLKLNYFSIGLIKGPRPVRGVLRAGFTVLWYVGQKLAPLLDKLDKNWALDTAAYFVTARKK